MKVFVTGATGFVGTALVERLLKDGHSVVAVARNVPSEVNSSGVIWHQTADIQNITNWSELLLGCDAVVHLAARVHVVNDRGVDLLSVYRSTNSDVTLSLANSASKIGIKRFVFVSSMKACGEFGTFDESCVAFPQDPYGLSKREAEVGLLQLAKTANLEVVVLRPPLIYGPGVKANFQSLMKIVSKGIPLPLGSAKNKRSLVFVGNFADAIVQSLTDKRAVNQIFFVTDGEDLSTVELIRMIGKCMRIKPILFSLPNWLFKFGLALVGRQTHYQKLLGTLVAKPDKFRTMLDWKPPYTMQEGIDLTVRSFIQSKK